MRYSLGFNIFMWPGPFSPTAKRVTF